MEPAPDPATIDGLETALARLGPALEAFAARPPDGPLPAFAGEVGPLPEEGAGLDVVLDELVAHVGAGCRIGMPGWLGYITTAPTTAPVAAAAAASVAGAQRYLLHSFNHLEHVALDWLARLCGIPPSAGGVFTSGGSTANLVGLGAARQRAFEARGHDVAAGGLPALPARVYGSERAHRTVHRAAAVLGLGRESVVEVATDRAGHLELAALDATIARDRAAGVVPVAVVAVAGTTDTGSVDDLAGAAEVCRRHGVWLHVDGAYGLVARASPDHQALFTGVELADSWVVDPHKWLATGVGTGAAYVADAEVMVRAFAEGHAAYLEGSFEAAGDGAVSQFDGLGAGWSDQGVELSAPSRGVSVWAVLREIGREGVARRVARDVGLARALADAVRHHPELELMCEADLSIVCFRYHPLGGRPDGALDALNAAVATELRRTTVTVPSTTVVDGRFCLRACFINPRTTAAEVESLIGSTVSIGRRLAG